MTTLAPEMPVRRVKRGPSSLALAFTSLLRADVFVQWRQRRALFMSHLVPVAFVVAYKDLIPVIGGPAVLAICIAVGLPATGLMAYSATVARDRERGVFQRLRAAPVPTAAIMGSRIIVQLAVITTMTITTCAFAAAFAGVNLSASSFLMVVVAALIGGATFLGMGQLVVAILRSSEAVGATVRLLYVVIAIVGGMGATGTFGSQVKNIVIWSPFGTSKGLLLAAMSPDPITASSVTALALTVGYAVVFAVAGTRWFKWTLE
jgi:ABC-2 type transport system permease protein